MSKHKLFKRLPRHIGIIPDGNRRWALGQGLSKESGYSEGLPPGLMLYEMCLELGIDELTFYGFTQDNTKRPSIQRQAFQNACIQAVQMLSGKNASLLVVGDTSSPMFPRELLPFTQRHTFGDNLIKINFLVNYGWKWDLNNALKPENNEASGRTLMDQIASRDVSRIDLIIRWGGRRRLSGFLPVQTIYSDFYILDDLWPDFEPDHLYQALAWYEQQDITLGG